MNPDFSMIENSLSEVGVYMDGKLLLTVKDLHDIDLIAHLLKEITKKRGTLTERDKNGIVWWSNKSKT